jgi:hypothetical protein
MIPLETLQKFCSTDESRYNLHHKPFSQEQWTFATNGHIAIRVPRMAGGPEIKGTPDMVKLFDGVIFDHPNRVWVDVPEAVIEVITCDVCRGERWVRDCPCESGCAKCRESKGLVPTNADDEFAEECFECDGVGERRSGYVFVKAPKGEVKLASVYIELLHLLPNCKLGLLGDESSIGVALCFRFDGGSGLLMPVRHP